MLRFEADVKSLVSELKEENKRLQTEVRNVVGALAGSAHAKVLDIANDKLRSLSKKYKDAVDFNPIDKDTWIITINKEALFIEDGNQPWSMYDSISKSPKAKTSKDGYKYLTIPFEHSKAPSEQSDNAKALTGEIKKYLSAMQIPYKKIQYNPDGSPKLGLLHKFDILSPTGREKEGHKSPILAGLSVYQRKDEKGKVKKDIMTFRVVSEKNKGDGRWEYPERQGVKILDEVYEWIGHTWESEILPRLTQKYGGGQRG
jgi:hypothetical protein